MGDEAYDYPRELFSSADQLAEAFRKPHPLICSCPRCIAICWDSRATFQDIADTPPGRITMREFTNDAGPGVVSARELSALDYVVLDDFDDDGFED